MPNVGNTLFCYISVLLAVAIVALLVAGRNLYLFKVSCCNYHGSELSPMEEILSLSFRVKAYYTCDFAGVEWFFWSL